MTWVLTSYIIAAAIMTPLSGWLAGQIGRRRVFLFSVVGFTIASALCGLAQSLPEIVIARLLQGLCGAALIPMSQAVLLDINPPSEHARAMAIFEDLDYPEGILECHQSIGDVYFATGLLDEARGLMGRLPFDQLDLLVIGEAPPI